MSKVTTVVFDVYETLAHNNTELWIDTFRGICRSQDLDADPVVLYQEWKALEVVFREQRLNLEEPEKSPPFKSYEEAWRDCFCEVFARMVPKGDAFAAARRTIRDMGLREPYQDAVTTMPEIQAHWRTGILSNADDGYLSPLLSKLGWKFAGVVSSESARAYKPLPFPFSQIMEILGVSADEAIYVGDNQYDDVLGAKGVGMKVAWVNRQGSPLNPQLPRPDYQVRSLQELPDILRLAS